MPGINKFIGIGNVCADPTVRYTKSGQAVASFSIACNETYKDKDGNKQESVEFVNITAWGKLGEICGEYLQKGKQVYVEGKLKTDKYEDKDGNERQSTGVTIHNMTMLGQTGGGQGDPSGSGNDFEDDTIPF